MTEQRTFNHEELSFEHDDEDFLYVFHGFPPTGIEKVTLRRACPLPASDHEIIFPNGTSLVAHTAVLVLYKASLGGQPMIGFLPDVLKTVLRGALSRESTVAGIKRAIEAFPVKNAVAKVEDVMAFVEPYAPWKGTTPTTERNKTPKEKTPDNAARNSIARKPSTTDTTIALPTPASIRTPSHSPPNQQQQKSSPLSAVLNQPASRKHALDPEDETATPPLKKKSSPSASSPASTSSTPAKSLSLKTLPGIPRSSSIPATKLKISVAKKSAPSTLSPLPPKTVGAKVVKPAPKETSQKGKLSRLMKIHVEATKLHELTAAAANKVTRSPIDLTKDSPTSLEASSSVKFCGTAKIETFTNKAASRSPPASKTPVPAPAVAKSRFSSDPSPYRTPILRLRTGALPATKSSPSVTIQTQTEPKAGNTPTAPVSSTSPAPQMTAAKNVQPSVAQPMVTPSVSIAVEQSPKEPTPSSPERRRIVCNLDEEFSPGSDDSIPSPPPHEPSVEEIPQQIPTSHKFIVKLRNPSPLPPAPQPTNDTPTAPATPAPEPDTRLPEVTVIKSPTSRPNENPMPSPTISELSSLSSQFEEDTQHLPRNDNRLDEFLKQDEAIQAEHDKRRRARFTEFMAGKDDECRTVKRLLHDEISRCDAAQAKLLEAEFHVQELEGVVAKVKADRMETQEMLWSEEELRKVSEINFQKAEHELGEAETRYRRAEEALETARRVHTREKEEWKKDKATEIEKAVAAERAQSKTMRDQIRKQVTEDLTAKEAEMKKGMEDDVRKQFAEERRRELAQLNQEKKRLENELLEVVEKWDGLVTLLSPYKPLFNERLNNYMDAFVDPL